MVWTTYEIISDGDLQGTSSTSSSLSPEGSLSPLTPSRFKLEPVNMSGTGRIDGLRDSEIYINYKLVPKIKRGKSRY